ncbi:MAG: hypothetical protein ACTHJQ_24880 [Rhizobiaceae bacterium]
MADFYPDRIWALEFGVASPYRVSCSMLEHEPGEAVEYVIIDRYEALRAENERLTRDVRIAEEAAEIAIARRKAAEAREAKAVEDMRERAAKVAETLAVRTHDTGIHADRIAAVIRTLPTEAQNDA